MEHKLTMKIGREGYEAVDNHSIVLCTSDIRSQFDIGINAKEIELTISDEEFDGSVPAILNKRGYWVLPNGRKHWLYTSTTIAIGLMFGFDFSTVRARELPKEHVFYVKIQEVSNRDCELKY